MKFQAGLAKEGYKATWGDGWKLREEMKNICGVEEIRLTTARRDFAAAQVCIFPQEPGTLTIGGATAFSPYGLRGGLRLDIQMDGFEPKMQHVGYITDDDYLEKTDILLNDETIEMEAQRAAMVWVEIPVPAETKAGEYTGSVRIYEHFMFGEEKLVKELHLTLCVKDVVLPEKQTFYLDLWQHSSNIARKHEVALWSDEHFAVLERYVKSLGELGQCAATVIVSEMPWTGQRGFYMTNYNSNLYEYSMIRTVRAADGTFSYDYSAMQRYIDLCKKYGVDQEIEVFGLCNIWVDEEEGFGACSDYPDGIRVRYLDEKDGCYRFMDSKADICGYIRALHDYFVSTNQIDIVRIAADEPADIVKHRERIDLLKECGPKFQYKAAINHIEFIEEFKEELNDVAPLLPFAYKENKALQEVRARENGRVIYYVCCGPDFPNTFLCSPLFESRLIGLFAQYLNLDGFLRWNYTVWSENPREHLGYRMHNWHAGDTNFVYPSRGGDVMLTLRYKALKRGIGDFELAKMANLTADDALWDMILKNKAIDTYYDDRLLGDPSKHYEQDYAAYEAFKNELLRRIEEAK